MRALPAAALLSVIAAAAGATPADYGARAVAFSPDGAVVAAAPSDPADAAIRILDGRDGRLLGTLAGHLKQVHAVAFSPDGARLASGSMDDTVRLWDWRAGKLLATLRGHHRWVNAVAWSPDGRRLASASTDRTVRVWDAAGGGTLLELQGPNQDWVLDVAWSPDGRRLAAGGADNALRIWDAESGALLKTLSGHERWVRSVSWTPGGLVTGSLDGTVAVWDPEGGAALRRWRAGPSWIASARLSPDGRRLATAGMEGAVQLWDPATGRLERRLQTHLPWPTSLAWSGDGRRLAAASFYEDNVFAWDAPHWGVRELPDRPEGAAPKQLLALAFGAGGRLLAGATNTGKIRIWDYPRGELRLAIAAGADVRSLAFTADGRYLISAGDYKPVRVWDLATGLALRELPGTHSYFLALSGDGRLLAACERDGENERVRVFETAGWSAARTLSPGGKGRVYDLKLSQDGRWLAAATASGGVSVWDLSTGTGERRDLDPGAPAQSLAFAAGGLLITAGDAIVSWDPATGRRVSELARLKPNALALPLMAPHTRLEASPDGRWLAAASVDQELRVWDLLDPARPALVRSRNLEQGEGFDHESLRSQIITLAFRPDGRSLALAGGPQVREWDLESDRWLTFRQGAPAAKPPGQNGGR